MRNVLRVTVAMTGWLIAATALAPRAAQGHAESLPWLDEGSASGVAQVRFVNGLVDDVAVEAGDHLAFTGVEFRRTTSYAEVGVDRARFVLRSGDGSIIASVEDRLDVDAKYTLVAARNADGDPALVVLRDQDTAGGEEQGSRSMFMRASY